MKTFIATLLALLLTLPLMAEPDRLCGYRRADFETPKHQVCFAILFEAKGRQDYGILLGAVSALGQWRVLLKSCETLTLSDDQILDVEKFDCELLDRYAQGAPAPWDRVR